MRLTSYGAPDPELLGPRALRPLPPEFEGWRNSPPHSAYAREMVGSYDLGVPVRFRTTPPGQRKVSEIATPGTVVSTTYGPAPYVVLQVVGPFFYHPPESGETYEHWSLHLVSRDEWSAGRTEASSWVNEIVAVDGRLLMLFENNQDEVLIEGRAGPVRRLVQMEMFP